MQQPRRSDAYRFAYFDETRSHEVLTDVESVPEGLRLVVMETPYGSRDPSEAVIHEDALQEPWEAQLAIRELEARLAASGTPYYRVHEGSVEPVPFRSRARVDYAPQEFLVPGDGDAPLRVQVNHYHAGPDGSRLQLAVPRVDVDAERYALAELAFKFPNVGAGSLTLVHAQLSPGTLRNRWVNAHLDLAQAGYRKLVTESDYAAAFGADWQAAWRESWRLALDRFMDADFSTTEGDAEPAAPKDDAPEDPRALLQDPVLLALRRTYVSPDAHARLLKEGEFPIRRFIAGLRKRVAHDKQHALSLLEAALLTEHALRRGRIGLVQEEGRRMARMLRDYAHARRA